MQQRAIQGSLLPLNGKDFDPVEYMSNKIGNILPMMLPNPDIVHEARRIISEASERQITMRLLGGLAVKLRSPSADHRALYRTYPDIDFATSRHDGPRVEKLLGELGYMPNKTFNLLNGHERLIFYDQVNQRQIDVFVGTFAMCHRLPISDRLRVDALTLPLAELFLTKLQIVEMNAKDLQDLYALLLDHPIGTGDHETINAQRIAKLCAKDWGLYKTVLVSLAKLKKMIGEYSFSSEEQILIVERIGQLSAALDREPKSLPWKLRAQVGERVRWYDLPEEVRR